MKKYPAVLFCISCNLIVILLACAPSQNISLQSLTLATPYQAIVNFAEPISQARQMVLAQELNQFVETSTLIITTDKSFSLDALPIFINENKTGIANFHIIGGSLNETEMTLLVQTLIPMTLSTIWNIPQNWITTYVAVHPIQLNFVKKSFKTNLLRNKYIANKLIA